jgi:hypothetical protein
MLAIVASIFLLHTIGQTLQAWRPNVPRAGIAVLTTDG